MGVEVTTSALRDSADALTGSGAAVGQNADQLTHTSDTAVAAHPGWAMADAMRDCVDAWRSRLHLLSEELHGTAAALRTSADNYDGSENSAAAQSDSLAAQLGAGRGA